MAAGEYSSRDGSLEAKFHILKRLLDKGELELAKAILPRGGCVLDCAQMCPRLEIIEWDYECGYLRRDKVAAANAIMNLVGTGELELMMKISEQHADFSNWHGVWRKALNKACLCDDLPQLRWLVEHPTGRPPCEDMHLRAAYWLHNEFPEYSPVLGDRHICGEHNFEVFLFLQTYHPALFTPKVVRKLKSSLLCDEYTAAWLEENYFAPQLTRLN